MLHSIVIFVSDIEKSKSFYTSVLELKIQHDMGLNVIFHGGLSLWQVPVEHKLQSLIPIRNDSNSFELYFETFDITTVEQKLRNAQVNFFHGIHEENWRQKTIRFFDPDKHLIEVGEPMEVFVRNMYDEGLSEEDISSQTEIPIETVKEIIINQ